MNTAVMKQCVAGAMLMLMLDGAVAQVYKCPDADGRTVMQQHPCAGGTKLEVRPATGSDNQLNAQDAQRRAADNASSQEILIAIGRREPAIGMTEANLRMAMGSPLRVNRGNYGGTSSDQWVYERPEATWYVYVRDGIVASFQSQQAVVSRSPRQAARCPNSLEIRNMETAANSVTISRDEKRARQRLVAQAKACQ